MILIYNKRVTINNNVSGVRWLVIHMLDSNRYIFYKQKMDTRSLIESNFLIGTIHDEIGTIYNEVKR